MRSTIEMLAGLIKDLNEKTRWSGFSITADATVAGASAACAWIAGLPLRTSFARGDAEHDPWRFAARRLVEAGETDTVLWIGDDRRRTGWEMQSRSCSPASGTPAADQGAHRNRSRHAGCRS